MIKTDEEYPIHYIKAHNVQPNSSKYSGIYVSNYARDIEVPSTNAVGSMMHNSSSSSMHGYSKILKFNSTNNSDTTVIIITNNDDDENNNYDYQRHNAAAAVPVVTVASAPPYFMKCSV